MPRPNIPLSALLAGLALATAVVVAATVTTPAGTALAVGLALLVAVAAAVEGDRRARRAAAASSAALALGLLLGDHSQAALEAGIYAAAVFAAAEVVGTRVGTLRRIAITDPLTGLPDRRGLDEAAARAIADAHQTGRPLSVVHLDLDDFKAVNDSFGHAAGDRVLRACAKSWTAMLDPEHILARVGGDEFILVLPGSDLVEAELLLESLRFGSPTPWSHGIAQLRAGDDLKRCLLRADAALYAAKDRRARHLHFGERLTHHQLLWLAERAPAAHRAPLN